MGLSKIQNLEHKYKATRAQVFRKIDGALSSIERRPIPPKDIDSQALLRGPKKIPTILNP